MINYYYTSDLCCASVLMLFSPLDSIDKNNPQKAIFIFKRDNNLEANLEAYWKGELQVEPRTFFNQIKYLKTRLYE